MKAWAGEIKRAALAVILLTILLCVVYPLAIWGIGQLLFSEKANGSILVREKEIKGSALIAQQFTSPKYFHSRPSAVASAGSRANSGGSNLGPLSKALHDQVMARIIDYRGKNRLAASDPIPADAVSASASGLDPHISPANAYSQAARVARARGMSRDQVMRVIRLRLEERQLGIFGEKRVNVLSLNLALDGHE